MKILVTGSSGFIGSTLLPFLTSKGHDVRGMVRSSATPGSDDIEWDPIRRSINSKALEGFAAAVHLAGENIAGGRWTAARKRRIRESRTIGTRFLVDTLTGLVKPPKVLICASAIGYYGTRGAKLLREDSPPGHGFLPDVCQAWEAAANAAAAGGIRVVNLRIGIVLSAAGGAMTKMLTLFRTGLGGTIGDGGQFWSWIALDDLLAAVLHAIEKETLAGPVNAVSPNPVTNRDFTKTLARVLSRPAIAALPAFAARLMMGEMAGELLLASARVEPARLLDSGFKFLFPELEPALRHLVEPSAHSTRHE
jgi:uncharacterized protein (TIGR01777 family)